MHRARLTVRTAPPPPKPSRGRGNLSTYITLVATAVTLGWIPIYLAIAQLPSDSATSGPAAAARILETPRPVLGAI